MYVSPRSLWHHHPGVRTGSDLTVGERAADAMRLGMGSWPFVFAALVFLGVWMLWNGRGGFDPYPWILLNLVLSCVAALQGAVLLIAAKRADQVASELARHDYETDQDARRIVESLAEVLTVMKADHARLAADVRQLIVTPPAPPAESQQTKEGGSGGDPGR